MEGLKVVKFAGPYDEDSSVLKSVFKLSAERNFCLHQVYFAEHCDRIERALVSSWRAFSRLWRRLQVPVFVLNPDWFTAQLVLVVIGYSNHRTADPIGLSAVRREISTSLYHKGCL